MNQKKNNIISIIITASVVFILFLVLIFCSLTTIIPKEEEGLFVNFGTIQEANGLFEPNSNKKTSVVSSPTPKTFKNDDVKENLLTQTTEETVTIPEKKKTKKKLSKREIEKRKKLEEERRIAKQKKEKVERIQSQIASAFSKSNSDTKSQGTGQGEGNQGDVNGDPLSKNIEGKGSGYGQFSLKNRSIIHGLPKPNYAIQEEGIVVVRILVDPKGKVTNTSIALQGTNTESETLRQAALEAAKKASFNSIKGSNNQSGTITYRFVLK